MKALHKTVRLTNLAVVLSLALRLKGSRFHTMSQEAHRVAHREQLLLLAEWHYQYNHAHLCHYQERLKMQPLNKQIDIDQLMDHFFLLRLRL